MSFSIMLEHLSSWIDCSWFAWLLEANDWLNSSFDDEYILAVMHAMSFTAKKAAERLALRRAVTVLTKCSLKVVSCVSLTVMISFSFIISLWSYSQNHLSLKLNFFLLKKCNVFVNCGVLWVNIITSHAILLQQSVKQCLKLLLRHVQTAEI